MELKDIIKTQKQIEEMGYKIENNIIEDVCMNVDVDDPDNKNRGGIVFTIKEDLTI